MKNIYDIVIEILSRNEKYLSEENKLLKTKVYSDIMMMDKELLALLITNENIKKEFFSDVEGTLVFDKQKFAWLIESKEFLPDSYTRYSNKIGLTSNGNFISNKNDVVLDFPYKDCYLQGGQDKDDQKRDEIFYHETIASDQITRMLEPKVFTNAKRYTKDGVEENIEFKEDDNLIIKGNNLIVLSSLLKRFENKIKCIYIDPPYNTPNAVNNTFQYNNRFNHSTWLIFMKNRLDIAKKLLIKDEGVLIIAIDENEQAYLGVLLKELFADYETHMITVVHNPRGVQGANFSYTNEFLYYVVPKGKKLIQNRKILPKEIEFSPLRNWGSESLRTDAKNCFYPIIVKDEEIVGFGPVCEDGYHPSTNEKQEDLIYVYPIDINGIERKWRYARNTIESIKHLLRVYKRQDGYFDIELGKDFEQYKTVWVDKRFDSNAYGKQHLNKLVDDKSFTFPKSIHAVYEAINAVVSNEKNCLILDFFAGSGTTGEAVSLLNKKDEGSRKFILVEQMDYIETITTPRIVKSTILDSETNNSLVYCELLENSQELIDEIQNANEEKIKTLKDKIYNDSRIVPYLTKEELEKVDSEFQDMNLKEKKKALCLLIDKNKLYMNLSDINDENYNIKSEDKKFTKSFYKEEV